MDPVAGSFPVDRQPIPYTESRDWRSGPCSHLGAARVSGLKARPTDISSSERRLNGPAGAIPARLNGASCKRSAFDVEVFVGMPNVSDEIQTGSGYLFEGPTRAEPARPDRRALNGSRFNIQIFIGFPSVLNPKHALAAGVSKKR